MSRGTRVLMAWEHGRNLGHVTRLAELARRLRDAGADIAWALPQGAGGADQLALAGETVHVTPAPPRDGKHTMTAPNSFADILASVGFDNASWLRCAIDDWIGVIRRERVDAMILDYAPSAQLAAKIAGIHAYQITNGFDAPPSNCPIFRMTVQGPMLEARNRAQTVRINQAIGVASEALGGPRTANLRALLEYPRRWYDCIASTDPYGPRDDGVYVGPLGQPLGTVRVEWPDSEGAERVLVYLRSSRALRHVLDCLASRGAAVICFAPDLDNEVAVRFQNSAMRFSRAPVDLGKLLPQCHAVVNYGSSAMVCRAALAGRPQVMIPTDVEKLMIARTAQAAGVGLIASSQASIGAAISTALSVARSDPSRSAMAGSIYSSEAGVMAREIDEIIAQSHSDVESDCTPSFSMLGW